jgi:hypothetical protein
VIRVSVEVCSVMTRFRATVRAQSIERALSAVKARYPGGETRVIFPIEPEAYFVEGVMPVNEVVRLEAPEEAAG